MTSIRDREAGRAAEDFDNIRKEGGYTPAESTWGSRPGDAEAQIAVDAALAKLEAAFGKWSREEGRYIPHRAKPAKPDWFAIAADITGAAK